MCKKVLIAALAVVVALAVVKGTWLASHVRFRCDQWKTWVQESVTPEEEIARLRLEVDNLAREDEKHFDKVARLAVDVEKQEKQVARLRQDVSTRKERLRGMKTSLAGEAEFVNYSGARVSRADLQSEYELAGASFLADEARLRSKEKQLASQRQLFERSKKELSELRKVRQEMKTELQQLETALAEERQAQAQEANTIDDAGYRRIRADLERTRDRINVLKEKRKLKGEVRGTILRSAEDREQKAKLLKELDAEDAATDGKKTDHPADHPKEEPKKEEPKKEEPKK
jgi:septal ring factor EnvC (AmiA/AmiB activator)